MFGDILGSALGYLGVRETNDANSAQAWQNMQFSGEQAAKMRAFNAREAMRGRQWTAGQTQISRKFYRQIRANQYQTAMNDMRRSGLNPLLAYSQGGAGAANVTGGAASVASAGAPSGSQAVMQNPIEGMLQGVNTANAYKKIKEEINLIEEQSAATDAQKNRDNSQSGVNMATEDLTRAMKRKVEAEANSAELQAEADKKLKTQIERDSNYELKNPELMKLRKWLGAIGSILGGGNSAAGWKKTITGGK